MVLNQQRGIAVELDEVRSFVQRVKSTLQLGRRDFNVCFVDDARIEMLNARYRRKARPTDVLSFPWTRAVTRVQDRAWLKSKKLRLNEPRYSREFAGFLGDVVISVETARRNARAAGHSRAQEIRWLILHGVLHLRGYDHETDRGEMAAFEMSLRERLSPGKR